VRLSARFSIRFAIVVRGACSTREGELLPPLRQNADRPRHD
jgi:hypothetical protein